MDELKLPARALRSVERFTGGLGGIYKDELVSMILYGSAASGELTDKHSNLNILVVLKDTSIASLKRCRAFVQRPEFHSIKAVFMTPDYIKQSLDVFPIEFLDMKDNYHVLAGSDLLKGLPVEPRNLRFQCEHEIKAKLISLKQSYVRFGHDERELKGMLFGCFTSMIHIFRNALRLKGITPPYAKDEVIGLISKEFGINRDVWQGILDAKRGRSAPGREDIEKLFSVFADDLERAASSIDRISP